MEFEKALIIRDKTRLEQLIERFNSKAQAKFYLERNGGQFDIYEMEHQNFYKALQKLQQVLSGILKLKVIDRSFLPTYIFSSKDLILVLGQDGLVANAAKYVNELPIIAINPDPEQYDGVLLPFTAQTAEQGIKAVMAGKANMKRVTMAEAVLNDGQRILAFNDFYIGSASHVSSRYAITFGGKTENQSSSGLIVSTGAGATGWLSSIFNMAQNIHRNIGGPRQTKPISLSWEDKRLIFVVREPFKSQVTGISIGFGQIDPYSPLQIDSKMPQNGVIFSDGIESDFLNFNTGTTVKIGLAKEQAHLVV